MSRHEAARSRSSTRFFATAALAVALITTQAACDSVSISDRCITAWTLLVSPSEATVVIGVTWIPEVSVFDGCASEPVNPADVAWTSSDTTVVVVGENSGRFWTRGFGQATVTGEYRGPQGNTASTSVEVTVVESAAPEVASRTAGPRHPG